MINSEWDEKITYHNEVKDKVGDVKFLACSNVLRRMKCVAVGDKVSYWKIIAP